MKAVSIVLVCWLAFALVAGVSCELGSFYCDGVDVTTGGPLCFCTADDLLCGHEGFEPCTACPVVPR